MSKRVENDMINVMKIQCSKLMCPWNDLKLIQGQRNYKKKIKSIH